MQADDANDIAPDRPSSWKTFLKAHCGEIAGTDFLSLEAWTASGIKKYYIQFVIDPKRRAAYIAGVTTRSLRHESRFDRRRASGSGQGKVSTTWLDTIWGIDLTQRWVRGSVSSGSPPVTQTPSPDSAFARQVARNLIDFGNGFFRNHRFVICDRDTKFTAQFKLILGEHFLQRAMSEFINHCHTEWSRQGIDSERLGGISKSYSRVA